MFLLSQTPKNLDNQATISSITQKSTFKTTQTKEESNSIEISKATK